MEVLPDPIERLYTEVSNINTISKVIVSISDQSAPKHDVWILSATPNTSEFEAR